MVRNYKSKKVQRYTEDDMKKAIKLVIEGKMKVYGAAKKCDIPYETLRARILHERAEFGQPLLAKYQDQDYTTGRKRALSDDEEEQIVVALEYAGMCGMGLDRYDIAEIVKSYVDMIGRETPFKDNKPGKDWMMSFVKRHKDRIRPRKAELLTKARNENLSEEIVNEYYAMMARLSEKNPCEPASFFNLDETGLNTDPRATRIFIPKGARDAYQESATVGKAHYTVLFCVNGEGKYMSPFIVYKGKLTSFMNGVKVVRISVATL